MDNTIVRGAYHLYQNHQLEKLIESKVIDAFIQAESYYKREFILPDIYCDITNSVAGTANSTYNHLRFNLVLCKSNLDEFLKTTVVHEVAHLIANVLFGGQQGHRRTWKSVMRDCFNLVPERCHFYDTSQIARRQKRHAYSCSCRIHLVSTILHNKILRGQGRTCVACKTSLVLK